MEQYKKIQFLGCLIKISISVLNLRTESAKEQTTFDLLFLIAIYSPQYNNKHPSEMKLASQQSFYHNQSFSRFGTHFGDSPTILPYRQISPNIFLLTNCSTKIKVSQSTDRIP